MKQIILSNAFSMQMLDLTKSSNLKIDPISLSDAREIVKNKFISAIGHADTANILTDLLEVYIPYQRVNIILTDLDILLVAQVTGGRLPEGATKLPEGVKVQFLLVSLY